MRYWSFVLLLVVLCPLVGAAQVDRVANDSTEVFPFDSNRVYVEPVIIYHYPKNSYFSLKVDSLGRLPVTGLRIADALISFPGLAIIDYGGYGSLQTLSARGMGSQHTTMSINGVPLENTQTGSIDLGGLYLNGLSGASLDQTPSGNNQAPGTAQLNLNYRPVYDQWQVKAGAGGFGEWLGAVSKSIVKDSMRARFDAQYLHSREDYPFELNGESGDRSASNPRIASGQMYLEKSFKNDSRLTYFARGGYKQLTVPPAVVSGNLNAPGSEVEQGDLWHYLRYQYGQSEKPFKEGSAYLKHRYQRLNYTDRFSDSQYDLHQLLGSFASVLYNNMSSVRTIRNRVSFSTQYRLSALSSDALFVGIGDTARQVQRHQGDLALEYLCLIDRLFIKASGRFSGANEEAPVLPSASVRIEHIWAHLFHNRLQFRPYLYTAYSGRYPSFNELYYFGYGNPELPPEKRWQLSGGFAISGKHPDRLTVRTSVYHTRTIDRIIAVPLSPVRWSTRSFGLTKTLGAELSANATPWRWLPVMASANYQQARDYSITDGNRLPYIPDWTLKAGITPTLGGWQLGVQTQAIGPRYPDIANRGRQRLETAWLLNSWIQWRNNFKFGTLEMRCALENATGTQYVLVNNFPMPSRRWRVQLTLSF